MRTLFLALGFVAATGVTVVACGSSDETSDTFCPANQTLFCKCANGDPGTHDCNADGSAFGDCYAQTGEVCPERDDDDDSSASSNPSSSGDPGGPGGGGPGSGGAGGGGGTGDGALYAACTGGGDCQSGVCAPDGYCTKQCASYQECDWPAGDCPGQGVPAEAQQLCAPACGVFEDNQAQPEPTACDAFGLYCGYTLAVDGVATLVCSSWPDGIPLPPDGVECDGASWDNLQCNLGHPGAEAICYFGVCTWDACYGDEDCPQAEECSGSDGNPGTCG